MTHPTGTLMPPPRTTAVTPELPTLLIEWHILNRCHRSTGHVTSINQHSAIPTVRKNTPQMKAATAYHCGPHG